MPIHRSWKKASREKLLECMEFQSDLTHALNERNTELVLENKAMTGALRNVLMLARREKRRPGSTPNAMDHMIRFCREVGVVPTILRDNLPQTEEE